MTNTASKTWARLRPHILLWPSGLALREATNQSPFRCAILPLRARNRLQDRARSASSRVVFRLARPGIEDLEVSVRPCSQLQIIPRIQSGSVGDERIGSVVRRSSFVGKVQLPKVLELRRFLDNVPGGR